MDLKVDNDEVRMHNAVVTGIFVRAQNNGRWESVDICQLDKPSLLTWLRSRGGENQWAENVVGMLLGHGPLHVDK